MQVKSAEKTGVDLMLYIEPKPGTLVKWITTEVITYGEVKEVIRFGRVKETKWGYGDCTVYLDNGRAFALNNLSVAKESEMRKSKLEMI
jgi:hypothetical protein